MTEISRLDPLTRAAIRSGSDKYGGHLYTPIYHDLFSKRREEALRILEIGVGGYSSDRAGGLGLKMWADYFPFATIIGLDIEPKKLVLPPRITVVQGSQADEALLQRLTDEFGPFDIIIDDGSHMVSHMIGSFMVLYPIMAADGIYAIEDTQTSFMPTLGGRVDGSKTPFELAHNVALAMHKSEGFVAPEQNTAVGKIAEMTSSVTVYRNIIVFRRGSNTYPSNSGLDFSNVEVRRVFDGIAAQDARDPAPGGTLSRVDMLIWARKVEEAGALALQAAHNFPKEIPLLFELKRMMEWAQQERPLAQIVALLERAVREEAAGR